jgi:hypothetical protein
MARGLKSATRQPANRFYHSAKVSEYQFKRVLWAFILDQPVAEAAKRIAISANSINAIYAKLRLFFTEIGLFEDIYRGGDPADGTEYGDDDEDAIRYEHAVLGFHLKRAKAKRRQKPTVIGEPDYNWGESVWRFNYSVLTNGRESPAIYRMMYAHLLAHIRLSGPIGLPPKKCKDSARLECHQLDQRILWLERNAPDFRDEAARAELHEIRDIPIAGLNTR